MSTDFPQREAPGRTLAEAPRPLTSAEILRGAREITILHAGEAYRLRLTSNDRLILTK
jgi:hemin uptake protein HemP